MLFRIFLSLALCVSWLVNGIHTNGEDAAKVPVSLTEEFTNLVAKILSEKGFEGNVNDRFANIQNDIETIKTDFETIEEANDKLNKAFKDSQTEHKNIVQEYEGDISDVTNTLDEWNIPRIFKSVDGQIENNEDNFWGGDSNDAVAFSAYVNHTVDDVVHKTVVNNVVTLNDGNGYDQTTGKFTAPYSGTYMFAWNIASYRHSTTVGIFINGEEYFLAGSSPRKGSIAQGGNKIIVDLIKGSSVWTHAAHIGPGHIQSSEEYRYTTFCGTLLF